MAQVRRITIVPKISTGIIDRITPSTEPAINSAQEAIKWANELATQFPKEFHWRARTVEAFLEEIKEKNCPTEINEFYWGDMINNVQAFSIMSVYRILDLARSGVWALNRDDLLAAAIMARSALESAVKYVDVGRAISANLDSVRPPDFTKEEYASSELEKLVVKAMYGTRLPGMEGENEEYKSVSILSSIGRISRIQYQENISKHYEILCEIAHPNCWGLFLYIAGMTPGSRNGDEIRTLKFEAKKENIIVLAASVSAISWACATSVTACKMLEKSVRMFRQSSQLDI